MVDQQLVKKYFKFGVIALIILISLSLAWTGITSWQTVRFIRSGHLEQAAQSSRRALPIVKSISSLTLRQIPDIELWRLGLIQISQIEATQAALTQNLISGESISPAITLKTVAGQSITLANLYQKSWIISKLGVIDKTQVDELEKTIRIFRDSLFTGDHTWLVVFQNSQELRATGGFTGSYATVTISEGILQPIEIHDIYQPDGQFTGFVQAPPGVQEYLSSGKGLRLPDANWWPDFPKSAHQMLTFFALGKTDTIDGVLAINLDIVKEVIAITGPIYLPDYQVEVTEENIAEVLRSNRDDFFPGSVAKQHLLSSFFTSLKIKGAQLSSAQQLQIAKVLLDSFQTKHLQAYSSNEQLQTHLEERRWTGTQTAQLLNQTTPTELYVYSVESNVGINKANQGITRTWSLDVGKTTSIFRTQFQNQTAPSLSYVNYQRLYVLPSTKIRSISYQGASIDEWDEDQITTATGETFTQVGFLIGLLPNQNGLLTITLEHPPLANPPSIVIQKQSGIPPVELTVRQNDSLIKHMVVSDLWLHN